MDLSLSSPRHFQIKALLSTVVSIACGLLLLGEDLLVLLIGHFPRANGSFCWCSSLVGGELSPMRFNMVNGCQMVKTPGIAWEVFPGGHQNAFWEIKCQEQRVQFRSIWFILFPFFLSRKETYSKILVITLTCWEVTVLPAQHVEEEREKLL